MVDTRSLPQWLKRPEPAGIEPTPELASETADQLSMQAEGWTHSARGPMAGQCVADDVASQLAHIWEKLLGVESVSIDENYFDLGGDSSLTIQLFVQIEKKFGVQLPIVTLFEAPTVSELANAIRQAKAGACGVMASNENNHK